MSLFKAGDLVWRTLIRSNEICAAIVLDISPESPEVTLPNGKKAKRAMEKGNRQLEDMVTYVYITLPDSADGLWVYGPHKRALTDFISLFSKME
jgi:hypothetical protein